VPVRRGLRHVRATVGGHRVRVRHHGGRRFVVVRPGRHAKALVVRIRGVNARGRHVAIKRRFAFCS
jgi:hypothetical protein